MAFNPFIAAQRRLGGLPLRQRLFVALGGLVLMLILVGGLGIVVLDHYQNAQRQTIRENYRSVVYCQGMMEALYRLNAAAAETAGADGPPAIDDIGPARELFEQNLKTQLGNSFIPEEHALTLELSREWPHYVARLDAFLAAQQQQRTRTVYRNELVPPYVQTRDLISHINELNVTEMSSVDVRLRATLGVVQVWLFALTAGGTVVTLALAVTLGPAIVRPLKALTQSARRIADGQFDLSLDVAANGGNDEVGQLAQAFNVMTEKLREAKRHDSDRLARTEQTTQMAIDSLPDAVVVLNRGGDIELVNRAARDTFGLVPAVAPKLPPWMSSLHETVMHTSLRVEPQSYRTAIQRFESGEERFYLPHAAPLLAENGNVVGVSIILTDVTRLKEADEAKSDLVSTVSHELKTPLTSIRMATHMLTDGTFGELTERQASVLKTVRDNSDRLHRTIENLLGIGRIESGKAPLRLGVMSAGELVEQAIAPMRHVFLDKKINLTCDAPSPDLKVVADPSCVGHALTNLLTNAAKFTPAGGNVKVSYRCDDDFVRLSVQDDGPGIASKHLPHVFDKFYRIQMPGAPAGAGLGLAIAKEIVQAHGGQIDVESIPGHGATFSFTLPRHPNQADEKVEIPPRGVEHTASSLEKPQVSIERGTECGTLKDESSKHAPSEVPSLNTVVSAWHPLPPDAREKIMAVIRNAASKE